MDIMNLEQWKSFFQEKKAKLLNYAIMEEIDVQSSDEEEASQSAQLQQMANMSMLRHKDAILRIDRALARISTGEFGECYECGGNITEKRLMAIPDVITCISCAEEQEMHKKIYA